MVNRATAIGIKITSKSNHFIVSIIGSVELKRNGVPIEKALKALQEPIEIDSIKLHLMEKAKNSEAMNLGAGFLIQVNPYKKSEEMKMINITNEQRQILVNHLEDAKELLKSDDVNDILLPLDDLITEIGFNENYELNELGLKLQLLYDQLYNQNE